MTAPTFTTNKIDGGKNVEIWVLLIIFIRNKLDELVFRAERKIMKVALNPTVDALKQSARVSELINNKNMLVNLKVLYDRIEDKLRGERLDFIKNFLYNRDDLDEYCIKNKTTPTQLLDTVISYAGEGALPLKSLGFSVGKMEEDYGSITIVAMGMLTIKRILSNTRKRTPGMLLAFKNASVNYAWI